MWSLFFTWSSYMCIRAGDQPYIVGNSLPYGLGLAGQVALTQS